MSDVRLLDCTLRDGGYVNDWEFGHDNMINVFERLVSAHVDIIEVGFIDNRRAFDINRTIMPDSSAVNQIYEGLDKGNAIVVGMIDYGTCGIEYLMPCSQCFLDGIRVIFKKHIMHEAIAFCHQVKGLGYRVFVQAVSITSYSDDEMMELLDLVNDLEPYAFSIVDTYGLLHKSNLFHYFKFADENLKDVIGLGYHSHNNFQLAYANCEELLNNPPENRMLLVDGSLYGMGKGAGNAPIELLAMYMNNHLNNHYDISQLLEAIDVTIIEIYRMIPWGYDLKFYIAASHDCHPNYVTYLMDKKTLSIKSINDILSKLTGESKLLYDKNLAERLYLDYQEKDYNDTVALMRLGIGFKGKSVLLLGPGNSVIEERETIQNYIDNEHPIVIAVNFLPDYHVDYMFISNSKRYVQLSSRIAHLGDTVEFIVTSNVTKTNGSFDYTLKYSDLIDREAQFVDNPMIMLLKLLSNSEASNVSFAGFDGFSKAITSDYINPNMAYSFTKEKAMEINNDTVQSLMRLKNQVPIKFITRSYYVEGLENGR